jgi:hypothetical protein
MSTKWPVTRRQILTAAMAGALSVGGARTLQGRENPTSQHANPAAADPKIRGPFPILSTPFTASGAVDFDTLANQARFVDRCGSPGMIWPQSGDSVDLLTTDEKRRDIETLSEARSAELCRDALGWWLRNATDTEQRRR